MFGDLAERLEKVFKSLRGRGVLTEQNVKDSLREIRMALLEADVNFKIVKNFVLEIEKRALGQDVLKSLTPGQQVVKIVHEQLIDLMETGTFKVQIHDNKLTKILLVGLQGSGKTTACAKLAQFFRKKTIKPMLVACDVYRPAAIHQLQILGKQLDIPVVTDDTKDVLRIADKALKEAERESINLCIFDTAGRLHIDEDMMKEVENLKRFVKPDYTFFVADAMTGQDAVNVAREFNERVSFDGVILTKMDGDARGGAALSIKAVTEKPIVFIGVGEKIGDLEEFHADRMASRIMGMGDVLSLIERAEANFDQEEAEKLSKRLKKNQFTFTDFLAQLQQMKKMGPLDQLIKMIPGLSPKMMGDVKIDDKELKHVEAIIYSMTEKERENPDIINGARRLRIAKGSGRTVQEINRLLRQFEQMKKMLKGFNSGKFKPGQMGMPF